MWDNAPNVEVTVIVENEHMKFLAPKNFPPESECQIGKTWFLDVPTCQNFNVSMKVWLTGFFYQITPT